ncbi:MAG: GntR family transcriptional regulator [bacterium]|nr:GntR family transcriptional regulator [bacterium]
MDKSTGIVHATLKEQVTALLKKKILSGVYPPGTRLVIDLLAKEFQVSRTPVRDAIQALIPQGLIIPQGKGYILFNPDRQEVKDISRVRLSLEILAVEQCTERCSDDELNMLDSFIQSTKGSVSKMSLTDHDIDFHNHILLFSRNKILTLNLGSIRDLWWLVRKWTTPENTDFLKNIIFTQHTEIIKKISARDAKGASKVMAEHHLFGEKEILKSTLFK